MRLKEPKTTALVFSTGKMVVTGAKTEDEAKQASRIFSKMIKKYVCFRFMFMSTRMSSFIVYEYAYVMSSCIFKKYENRI